jgi:hypothetical protein
MPTQVHINNRTVVHSGTSGITSAFPDVCKTPTPAGPVPMPYPNISQSSDTSKGSKEVSCDGQPVMLKDSEFAMSTGDEAGSAGGNVATNKIKGPSKFIMYSFDVQFEGQNVPRQLDSMICNINGSAPGTPPAPCVQAGGAAPGPEEKEDQGPIEVEWEGE